MLAFALIPAAPSPGYGDAILIKGSRAMRMEDAIPSLLAHDLYHYPQHLEQQ
jgi:hypothetical protein